MSIRHMLIAMTAATLASSSLLAADETLPPEVDPNCWTVGGLV